MLYILIAVVLFIILSALCKEQLEEDIDWWILGGVCLIWPYVLLFIAYKLIANAASRK